MVNIYPVAAIGHATSGASGEMVKGRMNIPNDDDHIAMTSVERDMIEEDHDFDIIGSTSTCIDVELLEASTVCTGTQTSKT